LKVSVKIVLCALDGSLAARSGLFTPASEREINSKEKLDRELNDIFAIGNEKMKCPKCDSELMEKRHKGHRRSFYECPNCHYNITKMR